MGKRRNRKNVEPKIGENGSALTADRKKQLQGYIGEIELHQNVIDNERTNQKLIFDSAKDAGFHTKAMRAVLKDRKAGRDKVEQLAAVVDVYQHALGMLADLPLGEAAIKPAQVDLEQAIKAAPPNLTIVSDDEPRTAQPA